MKNLAFVLSIFVLLLATIPCCLADNCLKEKATTEQTTDAHNQQPAAETECGLCSPFYSCPTCPGFTYNSPTSNLVLLNLLDSTSYTTYKQYFISTFTSFIWQPPKIG